MVGLENSTSFIRAVRSGKLHAVARPLTRGRSSQVWEAWIRDDKDQLVAQGRVRLRFFNCFQLQGSAQHLPPTLPEALDCGSTL